MRNSYKELSEKIRYKATNSQKHHVIQSFDVYMLMNILTLSKQKTKTAVIPRYDNHITSWIKIRESH